MSRRCPEFNEANRRLWSGVSAGTTAVGLLLVEPQPHPVISHCNAVFARIIKEAKGLDIGWIDDGDPVSQDRLKSYDPTSRTIPLAFPFIRALAAGVEYLRAAWKLLLSGDILSFSTDGVVLGDILYDSCLARYKLATISRVNPSVLLNLLILLANYYRYKELLRIYPVQAVLVSHEVGITSGVLMRAALRSGINVFHRRSGSPAVQFNLLTSLSDVYISADRPHPDDMQILSSMDPERVDREFRQLTDRRMRHRDDEDAGRAFGIEKKVYRSKQEFAADFDFAAREKFVFVMLHAFNDHPHSHCGEMIFRDYYQWFVKTLEHAKSQTDVTWVFKEHPSADFYPTRDISLPDLFEACPEHVVFLPSESSFNSESLVYIADVIVTVAGTAGIEFAAQAGVPPVLAGTTVYSGFGFTLEPRNEQEYFRLLSNVKAIERLSKAQQDIARRIFLYTQVYAYMPFSWQPVVSGESLRSSELDSHFWLAVRDLYLAEGDRLLTEFRKFSAHVGEAGFSRLSRLRYSP